MKLTTRIAIAAVAAVAGLATAGVAAVNASTSDDTDTPIIGTDMQKASAAALASTGQGRVTGTEVGDEESYYEIEVTLDNGTEVDVQLDKDFRVVGSEADTADSDQDEAAEGEIHLG